MTGTLETLAAIAPELAIREIALAVPDDCRKNIIFIGSLAVGYHYLRGRSSMLVRTKDADCLLSPRVEAVQAAVSVTEELFDSRWEFRSDERWPRPGTAETPVQDLPAVRLHPPGESGWFLELLTVPRSTNQRGRQWERLETSFGHFGLCSFRFLALTSYKPLETEWGVYVARPEMMALANLLEHPEIDPTRMSGPIYGRAIKRSNKDLGRVLAIARLAGGADEDTLLGWPELWRAALEDRFPQEWTGLTKGVGEGLRALLASEPDLDEARHTCVSGLLASDPPTLEMLEIAGKRLLVDAVEPIETQASALEESQPVPAG